MPRLVIVLGKTKVNQHGTPGTDGINRQHDVVGLDVEVGQTIGVQQADGVDDRPHDVDGLLFGERSGALDILAE